MLTHYGVPFLFWLADKTNRFASYLDRWIDLLDCAEANL